MALATAGSPPLLGDNPQIRLGQRSRDTPRLLTPRSPLMLRVLQAHDQLWASTQPCNGHKAWREGHTRVKPQNGKKTVVVFKRKFGPSFVTICVPIVHQLSNF